MRLQKTSSNRHSLGHRYARSLNLLWRGSSKRAKSAFTSARATPRYSVATTQDSRVEYGRIGGEGAPPVDLDQLNGFSWWDLDSLGQFIANDQTTGITEGVFSTPDLESETGVSGFENSSEGIWYGNLWNGTDVLF